MAHDRDRAYRRRKRYLERKALKRRDQAPFRESYRHWLMSELYDIDSGGRFDTPRNKRAMLKTVEAEISSYC